MINNVIFDCGGVIVTLNRDNCLNAFSKILGFPDFGKYLSDYAQKGFFAQFENGDLKSSEFRQIVRQHSTIQELTDEEIDYAIGCFLTGVQESKVKYLLKLKKKYDLYLLSNINPIAWKRSKKLFRESCGLRMSDVFRKRFLSYRMNLSKPGEAIFNEVIRESGIIPGESLFIDDGEANIETAKKLGFKCLLYDVNKDMETQIQPVLDAEISDVPKV
ncbi:MAG: HAD-IA family hydrolase [Bacteroidales bacterium]|jgi:FMN phosphatase YigB (HAD superfamily)|nr:HAD-IA family hydrolase [Bacteroidales bacterium]